ncbi:hypothetical protein LCGC14_1563150 [marine sediment metagenome]|uniref:Uncharacterized protein n=1 Tax=marine sediment metagenome TaxID=412755 RepID=A0A0F9ILU9_9ZZZZ
MKIFGLILGCPEAVLHCKHLERERTRDIQREPLHGCKVYVYPERIHERRDKCCKCEWVTPWRRAYTHVAGQWM